MAFARTELFPKKETELADLIKALGHPARVAILRAIAKKRTCICGELVVDLPIAQATVSQHLKILKEAGLIKGQVDGPRTCYCINWKTFNKLSSGMSGFLSFMNEQTESSSEIC